MTSLVEGAGTLICRQRDLRGWITLERLSQFAMILQKMACRSPSCDGGRPEPRGSGYRARG